MAFGQCNNVSLKFVNKTGRTITIPIESHRVKNPGGLEGWKNLQLASTITNLASGKTSRSVQQDLSIKCVDDAEFEIHYSAAGGGNLVQCFQHVNIEDKVATLTLTNN